MTDGLMVRDEVVKTEPVRCAEFTLAVCYQRQHHLSVNVSSSYGYLCFSVTRCFVLGAIHKK